jgi:hypothetical protein
MLTISFEVTNRTGHSMFYVGDRKRLAGVTGVTFIDRHRLVINSLVGKRLYLVSVDWEAGSHQIVADFPTRVATDLVDFDGNDLVVTSNCDDRSVSLYRLSRDGFSHVRDVPIRDAGAGFCHGARFVPGGPGGGALCATCITEARRIYFLEPTSGEVLYAFSLRDSWRPKDVCFLDATRLIVVSTGGEMTHDPGAPYMSKASLVTFDLSGRRHEILNEVVFAGHVDSCVQQGGTLFVNDQMHDRVLLFRLEGDALRLDGERSGYSFPHGLDVLPVEGGRLLAVANYGTNAVYVERIL